MVKGVRTGALGLLLLTACVPTLNPAEAPEGYSLVIAPAEGFSAVQLTVGEPVDSAYVVVIGVGLSENTPECQVDEDGDVTCVVGAISEYYELPVAGEVERAVALVCREAACYALKTP